jgi:hypothetical protein
LDFIQKINLSNNQFFTSTEENKQYKVFISKGNNFKIIKEMFKKRYIPLKSIFRWWWTIQDTFDPESCNCLITQLKHQETLDLQPSLSALPLQYSEPPLTASSEIDPLLLRIFNPHDLNNLATVFRNNQNRLVEECTLKGYKRELRRQPN